MGARNKSWTLRIPIGLIGLHTPEEERLVLHHRQQRFTNLACSGADNTPMLVLESVKFAVSIQG